MTEITALDQAETALRKYARSDITIPAVTEALNLVLAELDNARRWNALMASARIRVLGSAGLNSDGTRADASDYIHFGMEFWSAYGPKSDAEQFEPENVLARAMLRSLAEMTMMGSDEAAARAAAEADQHEQLLGAAIILGAETRYVLENFEAMGMTDACELSGRAARHGKPLDPERTIFYLTDKGLIGEATGSLARTAEGNRLCDFIRANQDEIDRIENAE